MNENSSLVKCQLLDSVNVKIDITTCRSQCRRTVWMAEFDLPNYTMHRKSVFFFFLHSSSLLIVVYMWRISPPLRWQNVVNYSPAKIEINQNAFRSQFNGTCDTLTFACVNIESIKYLDAWTWWIRCLCVCVCIMLRYYLLHIQQLHYIWCLFL